MSYATVGVIVGVGVCKLLHPGCCCCLLQCFQHPADSDKVYECLARGDVVIFDRYAYSGVAYSAAKGLGLEWCKSCEVGLPAPDQVVLLKVDTAAAATRPGYGGELYEKKDMQEKVRMAALCAPTIKPMHHMQNVAIFESSCTCLCDTVTVSYTAALLLQVRAIFEELREPEWLVIDGTQDVQEVHNQVCCVPLAWSACVAVWQDTDILQRTQQGSRQLRSAKTTASDSGGQCHPAINRSLVKALRLAATVLGCADIAITACPLPPPAASQCVGDHPALPAGPAHQEAVGC